MHNRKTLTTTERERATALLRAEAARTSINAVAERIGKSRPAVSLVLSGNYIASPDKILRAALAALDRVACPWLGAEVETGYCLETNAGPTPTWDPSALAQRRMCQTCPNRPQGDQS